MHAQCKGRQDLHRPVQGLHTPAASCGLGDIPCEASRAASALHSRVAKVGSRPGLIHSSLRIGLRAMLSPSSTFNPGEEPLRTCVCPGALPARIFPLEEQGRCMQLSAQSPGHASRPRYEAQLRSDGQGGHVGSFVAVPGLAYTRIRRILGCS